MSHPDNQKHLEHEGFRVEYVGSARYAEVTAVRLWWADVVIWTQPVRNNDSAEALQAIVAGLFTRRKDLPPPIRLAVDRLQVLRMSMVFWFPYDMVRG